MGNEYDQHRNCYPAADILNCEKCVGVFQFTGCQLESEQFTMSDRMVGVVYEELES